MGAESLILNGAARLAPIILPSAGVVLEWANPVGLAIGSAMAWKKALTVDPLTDADAESQAILAANRDRARNQAQRFNTFPQQNGVTAKSGSPSNSAVTSIYYLKITLQSPIVNQQAEQLASALAHQRLKQAQERAKEAQKKAQQALKTAELSILQSDVSIAYSKLQIARGSVRDLMMQHTAGKLDEPTYNQKLQQLFQQIDQLEAQFNAASLKLQQTLDSKNTALKSQTVTPNDMLTSHPDLDSNHGQQRDNRMAPPSNRPTANNINPDTFDPNAAARRAAPPIARPTMLVTPTNVPGLKPIWVLLNSIYLEKSTPPKGVQTGFYRRDFTDRRTTVVTPTGLNSSLVSVKLSGMDLTGANLANRTLEHSDLSRANLSRGNLSYANLKTGFLVEANFTGANLKGANLTDAMGMRANFNGADMREVTALQANLRTATMRAANLKGANLTKGDLTGAILRDSVMEQAKLNNSDLRGANLTGANLKNADLSGANLTGANLKNADLSGVNLTGANLKNADLSGANLTGANLKNADLSGVNLTGVNLKNADLSGANLTDTIMLNTEMPYLLLKP